MKPFRQPGWWQLQPIRATAGKKYNHSISGKLRYPHMPAKGLSGSIDQGLNYFVWGLAAPNKKFSLSCDQPQTLVGDIFIGIPQKLGLNLLWRWHSPRPYTYYPPRTGHAPHLSVEMKPNNVRMRTLAHVDVKMSKNWCLARNVTIQPYADVRNLLCQYNGLWIASGGKIGDELGDPSAFGVGRRINLGVIITMS